MIRNTLLAVAASACLAGSFPAAAQTTPAPSAEPRAPRAERPQLFTDQEREQFRSRARKLQEERQQLNREMRDLAQQRAKEKGITLPQRAQRGTDPRAQRGMGPQGQRGSHHARGSRQGAPQALALVTPEERTQFRDKMRGAQTPEQRSEVRREFRSLVEQRAKEKGINLREPRGPRGPGGPQGGMHERSHV